MQGAYGGLICVLIYGTFQSADEQEFSLLTQNDLDILTNLSDEILATE